MTLSGITGEASQSAGTIAARLRVDPELVRSTAAVVIRTAMRPIPVGAGSAHTGDAEDSSVVGASTALHDIPVAAVTRLRPVLLPRSCTIAAAVVRLAGDGGDRLPRNRGGQEPFGRRPGSLPVPSPRRLLDRMARPTQNGCLSTMNGGRPLQIDRRRVGDGEAPTADVELT